MTSPADQIAQLEYVIREQMAEIDQLRAEVAGLVDWIAGEKDALSALQAAYVDPRSTPTNKIRAASSAIAYERSKPASVTSLSISSRAFTMPECTPSNYASRNGRARIWTHQHHRRSLVATTRARP
jgi:hypothetical protein